ncbi:DUF350 domain-containing protein [Nocardia seriolae]|uniref:UPF0719 transmembrane protein n=1 Tax=Nocardia seriolae TaxID=37332 RepID=A0A0B8N8E9_9NOCA|nr:DUF350 domain-containing protein [Nocardia seriolae]APB00535.1 UPF0719 transmembrane protein [Nocardia seriolae]MTJ61968.1 DUF350 domain-containing protein [Nocardia seriolae]MTJ73215.1 DUF350 domain-containing protein [Nocardia seriolae]MTJ90005.1 DUF350 domain-containing protein [Nocardia seriolae]MTK33979.1 DUF350 domain-containing protein [Nocardia seriolae]
MTTTLALEAGYWHSLGRGVGAIVLYALLGLALMLIGFQAVDWTTPGNLRALVARGMPNAIVVSAAAMVSMALIVVLAIFAQAGRLSEGLIAASVYGLVGIVAQVISVRVIAFVLGIDIGTVLKNPEFRTESVVISAAHIAIGLVVAVAIL